MLLATVTSMQRATVTMAMVAISTVAVAVEPETTVQAATRALEQIMSDPETAIPLESLRDAQGLLIFPKQKQFGFVASVGRADGVLLTRDAAGNWQAPKFVRYREGGVGAHVSYRSSDEFLLFMTRNKAKHFVEYGSLQLALGASTNLPKLRNMINKQPNAVVEAYSASEGFFGGVGLRSVYMKVDKRVEESYYQLSGSLPASAKELLAQANKYGARTPVSAPATSPIAVPLAQMPAAPRPGELAPRPMSLRSTAEIRPVGTAP